MKIKYENPKRISRRMDVRIKIVVIMLLLVCFGVVNVNAGAGEEGLYPKRTDWYPVHSTSANISHYIYHDLNRNGIYDTKDLPSVHIAVKMTKPDGTYVIRRSNLDGFVNFTNSMTATPVDVDKPGQYTFEVIVPDGWEITSGNAVQKIVYKEAPTSRPGIIPDKVPTPTGIAQIPTISGKVAIREQNGNIVAANSTNAQLKGVSPSGREYAIPIDSSGNFNLTADVGQWKIVAETTLTGEIYERDIDISIAPIKMSTIVIGDQDAVAKPKANINLVDFEDVTHFEIQKVPNGIGGLNWENLIVTNNRFYNGEGYINNTISGRYVGYSTSGCPVTIAHGDGFDFYGGYFGIAWRSSAEGEILVVKAWRGDELIDEQEFELSALGPFYFDADYRNITKLELATKHYWQLVVDDILVGVD